MSEEAYVAITSSIRASLSAIVTVTALEKELVRDLREMKERGEHFKGIIVACACFQRVGLEKLQSKWKPLGIEIDPDRFDHMELANIVVLLRGWNLIDQDTYSKILEVKKVRDRLSHRLDYKIDPNEATATMQKAIDCLAQLYRA